MDERQKRLVDGLRKGMDDIVAFDVSTLTERRELGEVNFQAGRALFEKTQALYNDLRQLPIELLLEDTLVEIDGKTQTVLSTLQQVAAFSIVQANATQVRDELLSTLKTNYDDAFKAIALWLTFLKGQSKEAHDEVRRLKEIIKEAKKSAVEIEERKEEVEAIAKAAQDAAAKVGVAHHAT